MLLSCCPPSDDDILLSLSDPTMMSPNSPSRPILCWWSPWLNKRGTKLFLPSLSSPALLVLWCVLFPVSDFTYSKSGLLEGSYTGGLYWCVGRLCRIIHSMSGIMMPERAILSTISGVKPPPPSAGSWSRCLILRMFTFDAAGLCFVCISGSVLVPNRIRFHSLSVAALAVISITNHKTYTETIIICYSHAF